MGAYNRMENQLYEYAVDRPVVGVGGFDSGHFVRRDSCLHQHGVG